MPFTRSLRAKTLIYVLIPTVLGLVAVASIALYAYDQVAREVVQQRDAELARLQAARLSEGLLEYTGLLQAFAAQRDVQSMDVDTLAGATMRAPDQLKHFDAGLVIYDEEGVTVWSTSPLPRRRGTAYPLPSQFDFIRLVGEPALSDVFIDPLTGRDMISLAVPVADRAGQFIGVVAGLQTVGESPFAQVYANLLQVSPDQSRQACIVDGNGRVIYYGDAPGTGGDLSAWDPVSQATKGESGALLTYDQAGEPVIAGFAPVPNTGWGIVTQEYWSAIVAPIRGYINLILSVLAIAVLSTGAMVFLSAGRVLRPIHDLTRGAQRIAGGDFDHSISAQTGDELETLGAQFNVMAAELRQSYSDLERRVADRTKELAALNAIAEVASSSLDLDEVLDDTLEKTLEVTGVEAGGIYLLQAENEEGDEGLLTIRAHRGVTPGFAAEIDNLKTGEGFSGRVVQTREPLIIPDLSMDPRLTRSIVAESGFRAAAIVPLASRDKVWGSLFVLDRGEREFSKQDIDLLIHIGDEIAVAVENASLFDAEQRRAEQFRVIGEVGRSITSILDTDDLLRAIVRLLKESFGYYQVTVGLIEGDQVVFKAGAKPDADGVEFVPPPTKVGGKGITAWVAATGQPLLVPDVTKDPRFLFFPGSRETRSELAVPMKTKEGVVGVLNVESDQLNAFDDSDVTLLQSLASQAAIAIENAQLYEDVRSRLAHVTALQETTKAVASTLELDSLLNLITEEATALVHAEGGVLNLIDWEAGEDEVVASTGSIDFVHGYRSPLQGSLSGWASLRNQAVVSSQLKADNRVDLRALSWTSAMTTRPIRSAAVAPLSIKGEVVGTLLVVDKKGEGAQFDQTDLNLLVALANQAAVAIENANLFDAVQRRAEQFRVLSEVGTRITSLLDVEELLDETVRLVNEVLGYYLVAIGLIEGDELVIKSGAGPRWSDPEFEPPRIKLGQGISGSVAHTGEPLLAPDVRKVPQYLLLADAIETRSELAVPLRAKADIIGVLDVQSERLNAFDDSDLIVLQSLADLTAIAIEEARLIDGEQRRAEQFRVMSEVGARITAILTVDELLHEIVRLVKDTLGYYHTAIGLVENEELVIKAGAGAHWDSGDFQPSRLKVGGKGITAWVAATGEPLLVPDVTQDDRYLSLPESPGIRSEIAVPLKTGARIIGVLDVQSDQVNTFDQSDLVVLQSVAHQAAIAIENARLYQQAQQAAALEERSRLARDLHDAVTQTLFSASLIGEVVPTVWQSDEKEGRQLLQELRHLTRGALAEMRTLLLELRPAALAEASMEELLHQLCEASAGRSGVAIRANVEGEWDLPQEVHVALYRVAQEALNNVVKHARASQAEVTLRCTPPSDAVIADSASSVELVVSDDGCGFDPGSIPPDRLGLGIIRERTEAIGAALRIETQPGMGTKVAVLWQPGEDSGSKAD